MLITDLLSRLMIRRAHSHDVMNRAAQCLPTHTPPTTKDMHNTTPTHPRTHLVFMLACLQYLEMNMDQDEWTAEAPSQWAIHPMNRWWVGGWIGSWMDGWVSVWVGGCISFTACGACSNGSSLATNDYYHHYSYYFCV